MLFFAYVNVCQCAPMCVRITRDREGVAAIGDNEAAGMTQQEERDRNLDAAQRECAAVKEVDYAELLSVTPGGWSGGDDGAGSGGGGACRVSGREGADADAVSLCVA